MLKSNKDILFDVLKARLKLLSRGIVVESIDKNKPVRHLQSFVGGTGPRGRKYYICYNKNEASDRMISLPIYPEDHYLAKYAVHTRRSGDNPHDLITEDGVLLKALSPSTVKDISIGINKISIKKLLEIHPYDTYTANVSSSCRHFENNEKCKFCTTDVAMKTAGLPARVPDEDVLEVLKITLQKNVTLRSITVSGGTILDPDQSLRQMISLAKKLRKLTDLDLFFQIEPCNDYELLREFSEYVNGIGICLDVFDETVRKRICPGKSKTSKEKYMEMWKESVQCFGRGNVESHCIIGLGEDLNEVKKTIKECVELGVKVTLLHVRAGSDALGHDFVPSYLGRDDEYLDLHIKTAEILHANGLSYKFKEGPGCIGCKGCNAMVEACDYVNCED